MLFFGVVLIALGLQVLAVITADPLPTDTIWLRLLEFICYLVPAFAFGVGIRFIVKDTVRELLKK